MPNSGISVHDGQTVLNFEKHQMAEDTTAAERKRRQRETENLSREEQLLDDRQVWTSTEKIGLGRHVRPSEALNQSGGLSV